MNQIPLNVGDGLTAERVKIKKEEEKVITSKKPKNPPNTQT